MLPRLVKIDTTANPPTAFTLLHLVYQAATLLAPQAKNMSAELLAMIASPAKCLTQNGYVMVTVTARVGTTLQDAATMVEIAARRLVRMVTIHAVKLDMTATASRPQ